MNRSVFIFWPSGWCFNSSHWLALNVSYAIIYSPGFLYFSLVLIGTICVICYDISICIAFLYSSLSLAIHFSLVLICTICYDISICIAFCTVPSHWQCIFHLCWFVHLYLLFCYFVESPQIGNIHFICTDLFMWIVVFYSYH